MSLCYGEGKTRGQVTELRIAATINQACSAIAVNEALANRSFIKFVFQANYMKMRSLAEGGNQPNLNLSKIKNFSFLLPGLEEQTEIVRRVDELFAYADRIEARYQAARDQVEKLHLLPWLRPSTENRCRKIPTTNRLVCCSSALKHCMQEIKLRQNKNAAVIKRSVRPQVIK